MPRVSRSRRIDVPRGELWRQVSDPGQLPVWWPRVIRVEGISGSGDRFTEVLRSESGRDLRADFSVIEREKPALWRFEQELGDDPFARVMTRSETTIELEEDGEATVMTVQVDRRLKGLARLGGFMFRGATRRHIDEALDTVERLHGGS